MDSQASLWKLRPFMQNSSKKYKLIGRVIFMTPSLETKFSTLEELPFLLEPNAFAISV